MMKRIACLAIAYTIFALPAMADGERLSPVTHAATLKECSGCHMVFPPQMLPARSWEAIMGGLDNHFGENATIDPTTAADITAYLVANAADAGAKSGFMRGIGNDQTPLRITETPWWVRAHSEEVSPSAFTNPKVGSKANCVACHRGADQGSYEDD